jgi:RNA polymerase sigma-70 factor (ECF subfamily)
MMEDSDAAVVARVRAGDKEAFGALVERHSHAVFRLAYRMTGNEQAAEDVVQETFLRAYRHLGRFDLGASFPAWLHRIALNYSISLLRKCRRQAAALAAGNHIWAEAASALPAGAPTPDCAAANTELQEKIESALDQLSPQERAAFVLRHLEDRSIGEISCALGVGASAAKDSVFRAVQKMRRALQPWFKPTGPETPGLRQQPSTVALGHNTSAGPNSGEQLGIAP